MIYCPVEAYVLIVVIHNTLSALFTSANIAIFFQYAINSHIIILPFLLNHKIIFCNFASEPRDAWCLRGGFPPGVGRFVLYTKGVT